MRAFLKHPISALPVLALSATVGWTQSNGQAANLWNPNAAAQNQPIQMQPPKYVGDPPGTRYAPAVTSSEPSKFAPEGLEQRLDENQFSGNSVTTATPPVQPQYLPPQTPQAYPQQGYATGPGYGPAPRPGFGFNGYPQSNGGYSPYGPPAGYGYPGFPGYGNFGQFGQPMPFGNPGNYGSFPGGFSNGGMPGFGFSPFGFF